jgi:L-ribulose-5-phosphate 4-epimerase
MLQSLKQSVYEANMLLPKYGLVTFTWGNVSGICRESGLVVIKPSGVEYAHMTAADMVVVDLHGKTVDGKLKPSTDMETHLALYASFPEIGGVVHTHSTYATAFAQAGRPIPCLGTTHADYFYGEIPITRPMTEDEINGRYEYETGNVIIKTVAPNPPPHNPLHMPAALVVNHGPFAWGKTAMDAVHNAVVLEEIAKMAYLTQTLNPAAPSAPQMLVDKHFLRKHGVNAYYGQ